MNTRGIPPAVQQVFAMLICPGRDGGGGTYPGWGTPPGVDRQTLVKTVPSPTLRMGGSLAAVRSYALGCEPLVTGYLAMGLTIRSSHKQELSSVYQFIDVLYSLCIYEALRHLSLSSFFFSSSSSCSLSSCSPHCTCAGLYILN